MSPLARGAGARTRAFAVWLASCGRLAGDVGFLDSITGERRCTSRRQARANGDRVFTRCFVRVVQHHSVI
ncbi:hypothetical protein DIE03_06210 [Burkholderia sp. Bp8992]|nr:hypothetical protein DIE03_06210 [Burkholderia sp. Bp8992]